MRRAIVAVLHHLYPYYNISSATEESMDISDQGVPGSNRLGLQARAVHSISVAV